MAETRQAARRPVWLVSLLLTCAVLVLYARACGLSFINFDDDDYVSRNIHVRSGLTREGLWWALTSREDVNWHPLTWLSLQLDSQLFGTAPAGYHRTNVLLHACNTVLLFWLLLRMTGALGCSALVAAFFALHPVHVEAVAWVTARKDVLSTFFWLLATAAYLRYAKQPSLARYLLVVLLFALGLMAKQMLVTLPATLLLLDYWPLGRWPAASDPATEYQPASLRRLLLEKLTLLALVIPASLLTLWAQAPIIHPLADYTVSDRLSNALVSYTRYLRMAVWPVDLAILYPLPRHTPLWKPLAALGLLAVLTLGVLWAARSRRFVAVGWLWFLGTLVPVIGLVQNGPQALADRYAYVPYIGLYVLAVWTLAEMRPGVSRWSAVLLAGAALLGCGVLSWRQLNYWHDSETLWRHAVAATVDNDGAHTMLGKTLLDKGAFGEAVVQFETSLRLKPDNVANLTNLAVALARLNRLDEAASHLERSLRLRPDHAPSHFNLGSIYERQGRFRAALQQYTTAWELAQHLTEAGLGRARVLARLGELVQAQQQLDLLLAEDPRWAALHMERGRVFSRQRRFAEAAACFDRALEIQPNSVEAWNAKGLALERLDRFPEAASCYRRAVAQQPEGILSHLNLAYAELASGHDAEAAEQLHAAFALRPDWPGVVLAESWTWATHPQADRRDGALALRSATLVCQATHDQMAQAIDVQAAAYAELGQFDQAIARQRKVLSLLGPESSPALRSALTERLHRYEAHQPYRQDSVATGRVP
jgi:protein O-mannosyl-transferase